MMRIKRPKRYWWLIDQIHANHYQIGAEVGCMTGSTTVRLLQHCPLLILICVDLWRYDEDIFSEYGKSIYRDWNFKRIEDQFDFYTKKYHSRLIKMKGVSWQMADRVIDGSLDFVFIDADHAYESVRKDILAWTPKLKDGGLLCGHDINLEGVQRAVKELLVEHHCTGVNNVWEARKEDLK